MKRTALISKHYRLALQAGAVAFAGAIFAQAQEPDAAPVAPSAPAPVIDDSTSELDATVVNSTPAASPARSVRAATASRPAEVVLYDTIEPEVIPGGPVETFSLPGSGYFVTSEEIRQFNYTNVNRVLSRVPGVYVREEDGSGLFPNISIRGVDGTRSEKITIMEDGILQAPGPYSAPSAYYSPNVARMAGVEVLKGSSQIAYGPNTTGGVINYLSTPIPLDQQLYIRSTYGSNGNAQVHAHWGDRIEYDSGTFGYLAEMFYRTSDGFRRIEPGSSIPGSDNTGFNLIEPMFKMSWEPNSVLEQKFEFKYGYTDLDSNESYLGLTQGDILADPYRRYAGTFLDGVETQQHRTYLKYSVSPTDNLDLRVAGYYNKFDRDWSRVRAVNGNALHTTLGPTGNPADLATLRGIGPGFLNYRSNARSYEAYGVQFSGDYRFGTGPVDHTLNFGVRHHLDQELRFQEETLINLVGPRFAPAINPQGPGSGGHRAVEADSTALWLKDDIAIGRLTVSPGVRTEIARLGYTDYTSDTANIITSRETGETSWWLAGVGLNYELDEQNSLIAGVHEGIALPGPRASLRDNVLPEQSTSYELGARHRSGNFNAEIFGFLTDFERLISTSAGLGLDALSVNNAGTARVQGIEALASYDPFQGRDVRMPLFVSATWTDATLFDPVVAGGGEDIFGDGAGGPGITDAALPYIPEWRLAFGLGVQTDRWGVDLAATYLSDSFGTALNSLVPVTSSRQGEIDGGMIVDLGAFYRINDTTRLIGGVHNLFEEVMVTSRIPEGARVNAPREFYVGFEMLWEPTVAALGGKSPISK